MNVQEKVGSLVRNVLTAMGLTLDVQVLDTPDAIRVEITGDGGEVLVKRKGEAPTPSSRSSTPASAVSWTTTAASSSISWATAAAKTTS